MLTDQDISTFTNQYKSIATAITDAFARIFLLVLYI